MKTYAEEQQEMRNNIRILKMPRFKELPHSKVMQLSGDQYLNYLAKKYNAN